MLRQTPTRGIQEEDDAHGCQGDQDGPDSKMCSPHSPSDTETYPILRISNTSSNSFERAPSTPLSLGFRYSETHMSGLAVS